MIYVESFLISALIFVGGYCTFFDGNALAFATLYVPKGSIDAYKKAQGGWHLFENIQELKEDNPFPTHTKE